MKTLGVNGDDVVGPWIAARTGGRWFAGRGRTIALLEDGTLIAGCLVEDYNQRSCSMHIAAEGSNWLNRQFLWACFDYVFNQLGCEKAFGVVPAHNLDAQRFDEHLGFRLEARLKDQSPSGDLLIYSMYKADCRWLKLGARYVTQRDESRTERTADAPADRPARADVCAEVAG